MEFLIAAVGLIVAVWMIVSARGRHRKTRRDDREP